MGYFIFAVLIYSSNEEELLLTEEPLSSSPYIQELLGYIATQASIDTTHASPDWKQSIPPPPDALDVSFPHGDIYWKLEVFVYLFRIFLSRISISLSHISLVYLSPSRISLVYLSRISLVYRLSLVSLSFISRIFRLSLSFSLSSYLSLCNKENCRIWYSTMSCGFDKSSSYTYTCIPILSSRTLSLSVNAYNDSLRD